MKEILLAYGFKTLNLEQYKKYIIDCHTTLELVFILENERGNSVNKAMALEILDGILKVKEIESRGFSIVTSLNNIGEFKLDIVSHDTGLNITYLDVSNFIGLEISPLGEKGTPFDAFGVSYCPNNSIYLPRAVNVNGVEVIIKTNLFLENNSSFYKYSLGDNAMHINDVNQKTLLEYMQVLRDACLGVKFPNKWETPVTNESLIG